MKRRTSSAGHTALSFGQCLIEKRKDGCRLDDADGCAQPCFVAVNQTINSKKYIIHLASILRSLQREAALSNYHRHPQLLALPNHFTFEKLYRRLAQPLLPKVLVHNHQNHRCVAAQCRVSDIQPSTKPMIPTRRQTTKRNDGAHNANHNVKAHGRVLSVLKHSNPVVYSYAASFSSFLFLSSLIIICNKNRLQLALLHNGA